MSTPFVLAPLDPSSLAALERRYREAQDPETRTRYQMVLLSQKGHTPQAIASMVLRSHDTVSRVLHRYVAGGLDAVPRRISPGRPPRVTPAWHAELLRVVEMDPHQVGVRSANWTTALLAEYLAQQTGITVGQEAVRIHLHRHGYVCKRPTWTLKRKAQEAPDCEGNA